MVSGLKAVSLHGVKSVAAVADFVRRPTRGVVVLIYHRVGRRSSVEVDLPADLFDEQIALIAETGRAMTLEDALSLLAAGDVPDTDPVVVTFDDGTADFVDEALPALVRHGVPATLYVATDFVDSGRSFPDNGVSVSWQALRDALQTGLVSVGSHTHSHALLDRIPVAEVSRELDQSIALVEDRLGVTPVDFAYPKAVAASGLAEREVRARFRSAAVGGNRANPYGRTDVHELHRTAIQVSDGMRWFRRKLAGGMALEGTLRAALNGRRYADART